MQEQRYFVSSRRVCGCQHPRRARRTGVSHQLRRSTRCDLLQLFNTGAVCMRIMGSEQSAAAVYRHAQSHPTKQEGIPSASLCGLVIAATHQFGGLLAIVVVLPALGQLLHCTVVVVCCSPANVSSCSTGLLTSAERTDSICCVHVTLCDMTCQNNRWTQPTTGRHCVRQQQMRQRAQTS
jgi:hypothetical protein